MSKKKIIENVTIGADPEIFLYNKESKEFVSAEGVIGGTKHAPIKISPIGHAIQEDNVMGEFNIPPCKTTTELHRHINFVLTYIKFLLPKNVFIAIKPSAKFDKKWLQTKQAKLFGCDPDYDAWNMMMNEPPKATEDQIMRTAGGHIHIGYENPSVDTSIQIIRALDVFLGVPSIFLDKDIDRRKMYGKSGCFRIKDYGVEYRTLSNFWIKKKRSINFIVNGINSAVDFLNSGKTILIDDKDTIIKAINEGDEDLAMEIMNKYNIAMPIQISRAKVKNLISV